MAPQKRQAVDLRASDWLARLQRDAVAPPERAEFERWLDIDPAHAVAFARAEYAWERAARLRAAPHVPHFPAARQRTVRWAAAAAVALVSAVAAVGYFMQRQEIYATEVGQRQSLAMADGSEIHLNTESRVAVELDEHHRTIRLLKGEALFKVAPDPTRPFVVEAAGTKVRALGTEFNVRMRDRLVEVTVAEGLVAVGDVRVAAGGSVIAAPGALNHVAVDQEGVRRRILWRHGVIELKGETLEQAVEEFNRYRMRKLVVADPAIAGIRVGGRFETDEAGKFLNALESGFDVHAVELEDGQTYLFGPR